ncbi:MAG: hypothetical protein VYB54_02945 [Pseudomonadota bacterium]|nr:hypothetical protein [Pseudomonadota bacterium]
MVLLVIIFLLLAAFAASADTVVIDHPECRFVEIHRPAPDVVYRPGVDVHGKPVAPADLPSFGTRVAPPEDVTVRLEIPLSQIFGANVPPFLGDARIDVGEVQVNTATGALSYRGQRLDAPYAVICADPDNPGQFRPGVPQVPPPNPRR